MADASSAAAPAAAAAALAIAVTIVVFVFSSSTETAAGSVELLPASYSLDDLREAVGPVARKAGFTDEAVFRGKVYVQDYTGVYPDRPGPALQPVMPVGKPAAIAEGKAILLDLGNSLPAAAAAGAAAGGAAGPPDYKLFARSLLAELKAEEEADKASVATPKEYEETGRQHIVSLLETNFGLRIVPNASLHRQDKEITAVLKGAVFDSEWDFRAPVLCSGPGPQTPGKTDDFVIYPDREAYIRPARPARGKVLTPTKMGAAEAPPPCDFIAIFEITTEADWTGNLLPRLEQRLAVSLDRARSLDDSVSGILDVVAVIGVLGIAPWQRRMTSRVTAAKTPLLYEMMQASRFVFLYRDYAGSPHRSIAGRSGGKGGAGTGPQRGPLSPLAAAGGGGGTE